MGHLRQAKSSIDTFSKLDDKTHNLKSETFSEQVDLKNETKGKKCRIRFWELLEIEPLFRLLT